MKSKTKNFLSIALALLVSFALPSLALAKGKHHGIKGKVTEVNKTSITISHGKKGEPQTTTVINVPSGTSITDKATGAAVQLSDLVGKRVKVKESAEGIAASIVVKAKHGKKAKTSS